MYINIYIYIYVYNCSILIFGNNAYVYKLPMLMYIHISDLAMFTAKYFVDGAAFIPIGLDEAIFHQPVGIGDMTRLDAKVVHAGGDGVFRVFVTVGVIDPRDPTRRAQRTNRLMFVFAADASVQHRVLPVTYFNIVVHVEAQRRHAVEGLSKERMEEINLFLSNQNP